MADETRRRAMLRLNLAPGVGPLTFARLMETFEQPEDVFEAHVQQLTRVQDVGDNTARAILGVTEHQVDAELALAAKHDAHIVAYGEKAYPNAL
ncbi:MAG TPA: helix-hairpin-helix domain-containing protein, partial [Planctomycetota bacterium]|nr:helix-hairpin-helix domain-containing protein [Planctomycetota bacterium]